MKIQNVRNGGCGIYYGTATLADALAVSESAITFLGGSLRLDYGDLTDEASMRIGYTVTLPEGTTKSEISDMSWSWQYGVGSDDLIYTRVGENYTLTDGVITTNIVFTDVPSSAFTTDIYARLTFTCKINGVDYVYTSETSSRSVAQVAGAIVEEGISGGESEFAVQYAKKLLGIEDTQA